MQRYTLTCEAEFNQRIIGKLDDLGVYWFTGERIDGGPTRRQHHLEVQAEDGDQALSRTEEAIRAAGGSATDLTVV